MPCTSHALTPLAPALMPSYPLHLRVQRQEDAKVGGCKGTMAGGCKGGRVQGQEGARVGRHKGRRVQRQRGQGQQGATVGHKDRRVQGQEGTPVLIPSHLLHPLTHLAPLCPTPLESLLHLVTSHPCALTPLERQGRCECRCKGSKDRCEGYQGT